MAVQYGANDGNIYFARDDFYFYIPVGTYGSAFQVFVSEGIHSGSHSIYVNGTNIGQNLGSSIPVGNFDVIGSGTGNSDVAEIILYNAQLAIRAKLLLVLTVLISTGEIPSPDEADALLAADDLVALEAYLIEHGVPVEQARDTLEPMAVGDRANVEKYLGTKYGITVAGGSAVDPSTVAGLVGWWKADSLLT